MTTFTVQEVTGRRNALRHRGCERDMLGQTVPSSLRTAATVKARSPTVDSHVYDGHSATGSRSNSSLCLEGHSRRYWTFEV